VGEAFELGELADEVAQERGVFGSRGPEGESGGRLAAAVFFVVAHFAWSSLLCRTGANVGVRAVFRGIF
jgi:hypothetical protein